MRPGRLDRKIEFGLPDLEVLSFDLGSCEHSPNSWAIHVSRA
jgi:hypothetical protein